MKVAFVLDDSLDKADGVQQYILTLGRWLRSEGHVVHYLVGHTERTDIPRVHSLSKNVQVHFNQNRMSTPRPADKLVIKNLLEKEQFDVLHVQMPYSPFLAGRIIKAASKETAIVGTFHIIPATKLEGAATRMLGAFVWKSLRRFDKVFAVSAPAARFARRTLGVRPVVLPNAISLAHLHAGKQIARYNDGKLTLVFLGRLVERKGCLHFLRAIERLHEQKELQNVRVLICGKGPLETNLRQYVTRKHLSHIVQFVGFVSEEKKADYLASADIAVMPSLGGESFGIVLAEAMAAGSDVVIGGDNVGYRTVLDNRKDQLVDPRDTEEFAKKLRHFIRNPRARSSAKHWQEEWVKQYDVRVVGSQLVSSYEDVIAKRIKHRDN